MPYPLSNIVISEKNALATDGVFVTCLQIDIPSVPTIYITDNSENIEWNGNTFISFPFQFQDMSATSKSEVPQWVVQVSNITRIMETYLQQYDAYLKQNGIAGNQIKCTFYVLNTKDLANPNPVRADYFYLISPDTNSEWATFTLGADSPFTQQFPLNSLLKNHCSYRFKDARCGYQGSANNCDYTLGTCRSLQNSSRFGGFPGVGQGGLKV